VAKPAAGVMIISSRYAADIPWQKSRVNGLECFAYAEELHGALRRMPRSHWLGLSDNSCLELAGAFAGRSMDQPGIDVRCLRVECCHWVEKYRG